MIVYAVLRSSKYPSAGFSDCDVPDLMFLHVGVHGAVILLVNFKDVHILFIRCHKINCNHLITFSSCLFFHLNGNKSLNLFLAPVL